MREKWLSGKGKVARVLLPTAAGLVLLVACRGAATGRLGEEFSLGIGQMVVIAGEGLEITFKDVAEDSRCPKNVTCIWEGRVTCLVTISINGTTDAVELVQPGLTDQPASQEHSGYRFTFAVDPYPEEGTAIAPGDYRLRLAVTR